MFEVGDEVGLKFDGSEGVNYFFALMILNYDVGIQ